MWKQPATMEDHHHHSLTTPTLICRMHIQNRRAILLSTVALGIEVLVDQLLTQVDYQEHQATAIMILGDTPAMTVMLVAYVLRLPKSVDNITTIIILIVIAALTIAIRQMVCTHATFKIKMEFYNV